jgi:hypothetical protein
MQLLEGPVIWIGIFCREEIEQLQLLGVLFLDKNNFINIPSNMRDIIKGETVKNS